MQVVATGATDRATLDTVSPDLQVETANGTSAILEGGTASSASVAVNPQAAPPDTGLVKYYTVTSYWSYTYKVLNVTVTSVKQTFDYQTNAKTVTKVYGCRAASSNYAPTRSISGSTDFYLAGGMGYCKTVWRLSYALLYVPTPFHREFTQNFVVNGRQIDSTYFS